VPQSANAPPIVHTPSPPKPKPTSARKTSPKAKAAAAATTTTTTTPKTKRKSGAFGYEPRELAVFPTIATPPTDEPKAFDERAIRTWEYPRSLDRPVREYQQSISEHALHANTLVCLPTGLGKTLIAATVIHNYLRWFPTCTYPIVWLPRSLALA